MIIIVCLDDDNGMLFNNRRQSRDSAICKRIIQLTCDSVLWMNAYSKTLFEGLQGNIQIDPKYLEAAGKGEYCFVENMDITPFVPHVEKLIVFRWNRRYPSDMKFPMHLFEDAWQKADITEFPGKSHDIITQEVYLR